MNLPTSPLRSLSLALSTPRIFQLPRTELDLFNNMAAQLEKPPIPVPNASELEEIQSPGAFPESVQGIHPEDLGPPELERASRRLSFPPSYVVVGIYRLINDKALLKPAWDKCRHGTQRGLTVGFIWVSPLGFWV